MSLRSVSAFETEPNRHPYRVQVPTPEQNARMNDRLRHGETVFAEMYPELAEDYELVNYALEYPSALDVLSFDYIAEPPRRFAVNIINELLAGAKPSLRDLQELKCRSELWHEKDTAYLDMISINEHGCWELPKYTDHIKPDRARYPQPRTLSKEHGDIRQQMGAAWMWERIIGDLPTDKLSNGRRAFWPDHRCNNKACVYPRHVALGKPEANDAFTARMDMMSTYESWSSTQWARPSFGYPNGLQEIVHSSEVLVLSDRSVILPTRMSKKEFDAAVLALASATHLPDGGYTTDPGYHVLLGALRRGLDFDDNTGCWNARIDLDTLPPHKRTVVHACGNESCCNIRHMDIADDQRKYYQIPDGAFITLPDGRIVNTDTGEHLPAYWESWMLYWNWLKKYSGSPTAEQELEMELEDNPQKLLSDVDFGHIWVHPLTGCWENERFYPRWTANGNQANAYGFHRSTYGELGRSTHRYLLYKYFEHIGQPVELSHMHDADHRCNNRRCCNPLHMQFTEREAHQSLTRQRNGHASDIGRKINQLMKLRKLGRR